MPLEGKPYSDKSSSRLKSTSLEADASNSDSENEEAEEDEELDEINGYHFVNCTTLFVAYIYVNSGAFV